MGSDPRFVKLRKRFIRQFAVLAVLFLGLYLGYIFLTAFARDFMAVRVAGSINVALILGVLQFASTFLLAWGYGRCAARGLDPLAAELRIEKAEESAARHGRVVRP
ncbi:uncharacterized membrane protein (DUF485 family) [Actinorugispora endophytica]|uniref:Uncharacterized membrane protein (DUF485 family) n=2 Tax=Actinorugispora endophytica TaxID=1605990 RepID=A0A4R6UQ13_9ACTN|nr:uncharacterized membrane protein (DUF485 family) [Actinorugispora endophytica]